MNIVVPAAGLGSRFAEAGYKVPKPFIPLGGRPMIARVMDNVGARDGDRFIVLVRAEHLSYVADTELADRKDIAFVPVARTTEGAACTVMLARAFIESDEPVLVANSDQFCWYDVAAWHSLIDSGVDGAVWTFRSDETKWSYVRTEGERVTEVAEKVVISRDATVGVYFWASGRLLCEGVDKMIAKDMRVNGEFYLAPSYNEIVSERDVRIFPVERMFGLGTPADFEANGPEIVNSASLGS